MLSETHPSPSLTEKAVSARIEYSLQLFQKTKRALEAFELSIKFLIFDQNSLTTVSHMVPLTLMEPGGSLTRADMENYCKF